MKRILILHASLGAGHLNAAKALESALQQILPPTVEVYCEDALAYANSLYRNTITQAYKQLSERVPQLYKAFYEGSDISDLDRSLDSNLVWAKLERPFFKELGQYVKELDPDAIICVQQIPSRLLQLLEQEDQISKPQYVVITDVIAHSTWINYGVAGYFLPNQLSANLLEQRGVDHNVLHVTGIPVKLEIMQQKAQAEARQRRNLPLNQPVVTLFGGGLTPKRVRAIVQDLLMLPMQLTLVVVAGRNEKLNDTLEDLTHGPQVKLQKLDLIDYVDDIVVASDLVITKAGGLITSEILARGTPMVIVDPIPGQEEQNADVIAAAGAGVQLRLLEMVAPAVQYLLEHPDRLMQMSQSALELGRPQAALAIAEKIVADIQAKEHVKVRPAPTKASTTAQQTVVVSELATDSILQQQEDHVSIVE
mgnify:FL=1